MEEPVKAILKENTPIRDRGDIVAQMRIDYEPGDGKTGLTLTELAAKYEFSRPTVRKVLEDPEINCAVPPVLVRRPGQRGKHA